MQHCNITVYNYLQCTIIYSDACRDTQNIVFFSFIQGCNLQGDQLYMAVLFLYLVNLTCLVYFQSLFISIRTTRQCLSGRVVAKKFWKHIIIVFIYFFFKSYLYLIYNLPQKTTFFTFDFCPLTSTETFLCFLALRVRSQLTGGKRMT